MAEPTAPEPIEVEVDQADDASFLDDGASTLNTSLNSGALQYEFKHGRRYHSYQAGSYNFPNDEQEQARLDMVHHVFFRLLNDRLFLAPLDPTGKKILDIGTGTGIWPIHMGEEYPAAELIMGNDLSPIQPAWVPTNVKFVVDDVELDWVESETYDFIHVRYMAASIKDWPGLVAKIYKHLKPGGWVEFQESANTLFSEDDTLKPDHPWVLLMDGLMEACDKIGRTLDPAPSMRKWVTDAGFTKVEERKFKMPLGTWPKDPRLKEVGTLMTINFVEGVDAFTGVLFKEVLGWSAEDVKKMNDSVKAAGKMRGVHPIFNFLVVMGQKPAE